MLVLALVSVSVSVSVSVLVLVLVLAPAPALGLGLALESDWSEWSRRCSGRCYYRSPTHPGRSPIWRLLRIHAC